MRGLVGGGVQVRGAAERDVAAVGVRRRSHRCVRLGGGAVLVGVDRAHIVAAERTLDPIRERQRPAGPRLAHRRDLVDRRAGAVLVGLGRGG